MVYSGNQRNTFFTSKLCLRDVVTVHKSMLLFTFPKVYHQLVGNLINNVRCLGDLCGIFPFQEYLAIQNTELKLGKMKWFEYWSQH